MHGPTTHRDGCVDVVLKGLGVLGVDGSSSNSKAQCATNDSISGEPFSSLIAMLIFVGMCLFSFYVLWFDGHVDKISLRLGCGASSPGSGLSCGM